MKSIEEKLKESGLTGNEAKVYLGLLKKEEINGSQLAKQIGLDRTLTYQVLNNLMEKGLVSYVIKEHKKYFKVNNPENLLNPIKEKEALVKDLIPELKSLGKVSSAISEINVYEGKEGIRTLMREIIKEKSFSAFGATGRAYDILYEMPRLTKELTRKGYSARMIMPPKYKSHKMLGFKNIKAKYLDLQSEATTTIFGDKVSIHLIKEKPIVILINNKDIAKGYQNYFDFLWKIAKR